MTVHITDVVRATACLKWGAVASVQNVLHYRLAGPNDASDYEATTGLATVLEVMYTHLLGALSNLTRFETIRVWNVTQGLPTGEIPWPTLVVGANENDSTVVGAAALVKATAAVKRGLARKFLGVFTEQHVTQSTWVGALVGWLALWASDWIFPNADQWGRNWTPGIWRRKTLMFYPIGSAMVSAIPAYQRRRRQGRGI